MDRLRLRVRLHIPAACDNAPSIFVHRVSNQGNYNRLCPGCPTDPPFLARPNCHRLPVGAAVQFNLKCGLAKFVADFRGIHIVDSEDGTILHDDIRTYYTDNLLRIMQRLVLNDFRVMKSDHSKHQAANNENSCDSQSNEKGAHQLTSGYCYPSKF